MPSRLTPKQAEFVRQYPIDLNGTQAAIRAGYSAKTAESQVSRLLRNAKVQVAIQKAVEKRAERTEITADRVLQEYARVGFGDIRDVVKWTESGVKLVPSDDLTEDVAAAIAEVSQSSTGDLKVKLHSKMSVLQDMAKHLGMFIDRKEVTGKDGGPVRIEQTDKLKDLSDDDVAKLEGILADDGDDTD